LVDATGGATGLGLGCVWGAASPANTTAPIKNIAPNIRTASRLMAQL
jgi:hypothetical protein